MPISPNSLMMTAVSESAGSSRRRRNSVVLPEPKKPVSKVTGVKVGASSTIVDIEPCEKIGRERIAQATRQPFRGRPEMAEILYDLALAGERRQQKGGALPIGKAHAIMGQREVSDAHPLRALAPPQDRIGVSRIDALARRRVRPMLGAAQNAA